MNVNDDKEVSEVLHREGLAGGIARSCRQILTECKDGAEFMVCLLHAISLSATETLAFARAMDSTTANAHHRWGTLLADVSRIGLIRAAEAAAKETLARQPTFDEMRVHTMTKLDEELPKYVAMMKRGPEKCDDPECDVCHGKSKDKPVENKVRLH